MKFLKLTLSHLLKKGKNHILFFPSAQILNWNITSLLLRSSKIKHGPYSGLCGRQARVCAGGSKADKWGWGTRRGTRHPSIPASLLSLTSACKSDQAIFQTSISIPLWMVRGLRICSVKLSKVPPCQGCSNFVCQCGWGHGAVSSGTWTVSVTLKPWGLPRQEATSRQEFILWSFLVEQNCLFPF